MNRIKSWLRLLRFLAGSKKAGITPTERDCRRDFCLCYPEILQACCLLAQDGDGHNLMQLYMQHVLERQPLQWWIENSSYAVQAWFIWQYLCAQGLVTPPPAQSCALTVKVLRPNGDNPHSVILMRLARDAKNPLQGFIHLHCAPDDLTEQQAKQLRCKYISGEYVRKVDECAAPIMDRAVQIGVTLLKQNIGVCVDEQALYERLLCAEYEPEHLYWVRAAEVPDWLRLTYPYQAELHELLLQAGGRWTGRQMLLPVTASERLQDIARLYNFRVTAEAQRRLTLWEEAYRRATIYSPRRARNEPPKPGAKDLFRQMLAQKADVPADLIGPADG